MYVAKCTYIILTNTNTKYRANTLQKSSKICQKIHYWRRTKQTKRFNQSTRNVCAPVSRSAASVAAMSFKVSTTSAVALRRTLQMFVMNERRAVTVAKTTLVTMPQTFERREERCAILRHDLVRVEKNAMANVDMIKQLRHNQALVRAKRAL